MNIGIGHNQPPAFDFFNFFDMVVDTMGMSSAEKLMQIIIARRSHGIGGKSVSPARAELARQASCSEATVKRSYRLLETFFEVNKRSGKTTEYTPKTIITQGDIELALKGFTPAKGAHSEPPTPTLGEPPAHCEPGAGGAGAHGVRVMVSRGSPSEGHGEPPHKKEKSPTPPIRKNINNTPLPPIAKKGGSDKWDPFGLNPHRAAAHRDVWFDEDTRLHVSNGFQQELTELAGGEQALRIELDRAAEWIGPNTPPDILKAKVRGRVQSQIAERKDRDDRYAKASRNKTVAAASPIASPTVKPDGMPDFVWNKIQADKAAARKC